MRVVLASKWAVAAALAFALTLPLTTCQSRGTTDPHYVQMSWQSILPYCFLWPPPLLVARTGWKRLRSAWPFPIADLVLSFVAFVIVTMRVIVSAAISLGGIQPGPGFDVAASCFILYGGLSIADLIVIIRDRRRDAAHTRSALDAE